MIQVQPSTKHVNVPGIKPLTPRRELTEKPLTSTKTVLVVSHETATRKALSGAIRSRLSCRVLEASGIAEARYLTAVEGKIRLLITASHSREHLKFARWFRMIHPESKIILAADGLWELTGGPDNLDEVLMTKSYDAKDLVSTVRRLLIPPKSRHR